jgi:hypothetical protein
VTRRYSAQRRRHLKPATPRTRLRGSTLFLCAVANILSPTTPCDMNHNAATTEMSEVGWRGKGGGGGHDLAVDNVATGGERNIDSNSSFR